MIYSIKRLINAIMHKRGMERIVFIGEYFWHKSVRKDLKKELSRLKAACESKNIPIKNP